MYLANQYRPETFDQMTGQQHLVGPTGVLTNILYQKELPSMIFYGPPGCGKTTAARILANQFQKVIPDIPYKALNATNASLSDIRDLIKSWNKSGHDSGILYLDEIQYFNKKQQQSLLPYVESEQVKLIGATTDNPYYCCYDALLSRCLILEFKPVSISDITDRLTDISAQESMQITDKAKTLIAENAAGDVRRAVNMLSMAKLQYPGIPITEDQIKALLPSTRMSGFDTDGDTHFALISALQKSIRGSDPNAAVFYLAKLLEGGDILSPCRRLMVIANEDIGLGNPDAIPFTYACIEMAKQLGLPEANKPLTNAVIYLAISPKCSTCENTYNKAAEDVKSGYGTVIPSHLRHACSKGYLYPHEYPNHWIKQQYLPDDLKNKIYYIPEPNTFESQMATYWTQVMQQR